MKTSASYRIRSRIVLVGFMLVVACKGCIAAVEYTQILDKNWVRVLIFNEDVGA